MAPEQATRGGVDERADVYALAAVTYHLLTGRTAHTGSIADLSHLAPPPAPSTLADVPPGVDEVVLRGLDPDRDERWPDVRSFVRSLQSSPDAHGTVMVTPGEPTRRTDDRPAPGSRVLLTLACVLVFLVFFGGALVLTQQVR
jgi:eukaryotic-like serine/threonine-protein kinase